MWLLLGVARGIRLFILWYQILGENAIDDEHLLFKNLIRNWNQALGTSNSSGTIKSNSDKVDLCDEVEKERFKTAPDYFRWVDIVPIWPKNANEHEPSVDRWLFYMLHTMSDTCKRILWEPDQNSDRMDKQEHCFLFLFNMFNKYYLPALFPTFLYENNVYDSIIIPDVNKIDMDRRRKQGCLSRTAYVMWLLPFINDVQSRDRTLTRVPTITSPQQLHPLTGSFMQSQNLTSLPSNASISTSGNMPMNDPVSPSYNELYNIITNPRNVFMSLQQPLDPIMLEIGQNVLLSKKEYINFIHEIFRQSYLMSGENGLAASYILRSVNNWIKDKQSCPIFMLEPDDHNRRLSASSTTITTNNDNIINNNLRLGLNRWLQIFMTQSFYMFLVRPGTIDDQQMTTGYQQEQLQRDRSLAGLVTFYRKLPSRHMLDRTTWDLMLQVMLRIVRVSLQDKPPPTYNHSHVENTIKTLLYLFHSVSLDVSVELWNNLSDTLSSKAAWPEVIEQWDLTMRSLTKDLGKLVYNVETEVPTTNTMTTIRKGIKKFTQTGAQEHGQRETSSIESRNRRARTLSLDDDSDFGEPRTVRTTITNTRIRTNSDDSLSHPFQPNRPILSTIVSNHVEENLEQPIHFSPDENFNPISDLSQQFNDKRSNLSIQIAKDSPSSTNDIHALDSPMSEGLSDDFGVNNTISVGETNSIGSLQGAADNSISSGLADGSSLSTKSRTLHIDSRSHSNTLSETNLLDQHMLPLTKQHPVSHSTVDSLQSFPQDATTIGSTNTAVNVNNILQIRLEPKTAYTSWFRMLGSLGNINHIQSSEQHNRIIKTLNEIWKMLCRIHEGSKEVEQGDIYFDGPPLLIFAPWLYEAIQTLPISHREGKLSAYKLLCSIGVYNHDEPPSAEFLDMFLLTLYQGLNSGDQDIINAIISSCKADLFHRCWPSSTLLLPLFTDACCQIGQQASIVDGKTNPKIEALTILSSLVCFPNHFEQLDVFDPKEKNYSVVTMDRTYLKRMIMRDLIKASEKDTMLESREIALCGLAIFICEELKHNRLESPIKPFMLFIVDCLQGQSKRSISSDKHNHSADSTMFAADMLRFLSSYASLLSNHRDNVSGNLYMLIIDGLINTLKFNIPSDVGSLLRNNVRIIKSLIFALLDWILHIPHRYLVNINLNDNTTTKNIQHHQQSIIQRTFSILIDLYRASDRLQREQQETTTREEIPLSQSIKLCSKFAIICLLSEHSHFPISDDDASLVTSSVNEGHDWSNKNIQQKQLQTQTDSIAPENSSTGDEIVIQSSNIQLFVIHDDFLISFVEIPADNTIITDNETPNGNEENHQTISPLTSTSTICRTIVRDLCGKYCWDSYAWDISHESKAMTSSSLNKTMGKIKKLLLIFLSFLIYIVIFFLDLILPSMSTYEPTATTRGITVPIDESHDLPTYKNQPPDADILDKLLQYIYNQSPELAFYSDRTLTDVFPTSALISRNEETAIIRMTNEQETSEIDYYQNVQEKHQQKISQKMTDNQDIDQHSTRTQSNVSSVSTATATNEQRNDRFALCRSHINQLGLMLFENRNNIELLNTSKTNSIQLLREMKYLDTLRSRETHKIAVIYIGYGQEDKTAIFNNVSGSPNYEEFLSNLGWEVELSKHTGFNGGLHPLKNTYSVYYADTLVEIMFHVATKMRSIHNTNDEHHRKTRHIGNDEVQIIWTEHYHEYDRSIIASQFGDVLIVIHPLPNSLYRIRIDKTTEEIQKPSTSSERGENVRMGMTISAKTRSSGRSNFPFLSSTNTIDTYIKNLLIISQMSEVDNSNSNCTMNNGENQMSAPSIALEAALKPSNPIDLMCPSNIVCGYDFNNGLDYHKLLKSFKTTGFQATNIGLAIEQINEMILKRTTDQFSLFLGYTSNMISCGCRETIRYLVEHKLVDCIVTTAGGIEEDFIKCLAATYVGDFHLNGKELRKNGINRLGNLLVPNTNYCLFEDWLMPILDQLVDEQLNLNINWTPSKLIERLGREVNNTNSVYYWASKNQIPVFCPAITDGSLGDMLYFHSYRKHGLKIDILEDLKTINNLAVHAKYTGMIILGGGVVKHHICNANLMRNGADYSVYINTGMEYDGSDSGAAPDEAVSWGKIRTTAEPVKVFGDASFIFPLVVAETFVKHIENNKSVKNEK
ncbi:unnamed protein product [Didymodactylos carnosus]|uniref:deoxyhypusine synthase n=1 Tax=Didymodactylos carnosus TaxID=1234261 RepID=A0A813T6E0_9BILA|nr:unnamed protein product [Didymodactylos carnosus]CAF3590094.1 unnamed protein product [Didymodactylos carnosus]